VQFDRKCSRLILKGLDVHLFLEVVAFCRELLKVAPADLLPEVYMHSGFALICLQKLDEAEELLHEGLALSGPDGPWTKIVSWTRRQRCFVDKPCGCQSLTPHLLVLRSQLLEYLADLAVERGNLDVALDFAHRVAHKAREICAVDNLAENELMNALRAEANILESLGRLDEAMALDAEWYARKFGQSSYPDARSLYTKASVRRAIKHMAAGEDAEAEPLLRGCILEMSATCYQLHTSQTFEAVFRPHTLLADLLERRGTEEALAEARTLRDEVGQQLATFEARSAAALEETRAAAAEAVRQWQKERAMARVKKEGAKKKGKKKSKKKGRRGKDKDKGQGASSAAAIEGEPPREPDEEQAEAVAAVEWAAAAEADQEAEGGESQPREEEEAKEECAICLQDLQLEDDEDPWRDEGGESEGLVVLKCGHRFHEICGDMWCAKCADKGWGVTCPRCRAPYVLVRR
jgi:hypothetical protein